MESENVANMRSGYEAFARGDLRTVERFIDPSFEIEDRVLPEGGPSERGVAALVANTARLREVFGEASWEPQEIVDLGDQILVRVHFTGTGATTELPMDADVGNLFTLRDGRAVKLDVYRSWAEARAAAGLED
jgi:ketosteroid isomerase-like protein